MIITYPYVRDSIKRYESQLKFYQRWWYRWFGEPPAIMSLRAITSSKTACEEMLASHDLFDLARIFINYPSLKNYFPRIDDFQLTAGFLDVVYMLNKADCLTEESLGLIMQYNHEVNLNHLNHHALFAIVLKLSKAEPCLLNLSNLRQLKIYQAILDYEEAPMLIDDKIKQPHFDAVFALCQMYSANIEKARTYIKSYLTGLNMEPMANPYNKIIFSRAVMPVQRPDKTSEKKVDAVKELSKRNEENVGQDQYPSLLRIPY